MILRKAYSRPRFAVSCLRSVCRSYSVFVFPGQGSQQIGMGKELAAESRVSREVFEEIDEALRLRLSHTMWNGTDSELKATEFTQPALLAHGIAAFKALQSQNSSTPVAVMGHSVGEYAAMVAAGGLELASAARLLRLRGLLMRLATETHGKPVAMQALLTSPPPPMTSRAGDVTDAAPSADALGRHIDASLLQPVRDACAAAVAAGGPGAVAGIAAINGPSQVVLSGDEAAVAAAAAMLRTSKFARRAVPLGVSCPFHCSIMTPAAAVLRPVVTALLGDSPSAHSVHDGSSKLQAEAQIAMRTLRDSCAASRSGSMPMLTLADGADSRAAIWREVDWLVERLFETAASHGASGGDKARVADGLGARQQRRLRCPIITNADAAVHHDPASAGAQLFEGITKPVLWYPCTVQALILAAAAARAADSSAASAAAPLGLPSLVQDEEAALSSSSSSGAAAISFVEFGPGNTLTTLVKQIAGAHPQLLAAHAAASGTPPAKPLELRAASVSTPADLRTALSLLA